MTRSEHQRAKHIDAEARNAVTPPERRASYRRALEIQRLAEVAPRKAGVSRSSRRRNRRASADGN